MDKRSKFFHKVANGRRNRSFFKSLVLEDGVTIDNIESISEEIKRHFGKLFSKSLGVSWKLEGLDWSPILVESAEWLDRPFLEEEILNVVILLNKEKAPDQMVLQLGFIRSVGRRLRITY